MSTRQARLRAPRYSGFFGGGFCPFGVRRHTGLERFRDIGLSPALELELGDVGNAALAIGARPAGEAQARDHATERVARRVTFRAVAGAVDQVSAPIPLRRSRRIGLERLAIEKQQLPEAERAPNVEWKRQIVIAHTPRHWRQRLEIGEQIAQIVETDMLVRGVWKRGI